MSDDLHGGLLGIWPDKRQIDIGGRPAKIGARAFDLLVALADATVGGRVAVRHPSC